MLQLVKTIIRTFEVPDGAQIGVQHDRLYLQIVRSHSLHADITESHIGETWAILLNASREAIGIGARIGGRRLCRAQERGVQTSVRIEYLRMPNHHGLAGPPIGDAYPNHAGKVLPEIIDEFASDTVNHTHRSENLVGHDPGTIIRLDALRLETKSLQ